MTNPLREVPEPVGEPALAERERRQRASAPTLRDLQVAAQELLPALCAAATGYWLVPGSQTESR